MEQSSNDKVHEHVINVPRGDIACPSSSQQDLDIDLDEVCHEDRPSTSTRTPTSQSSSSTSSPTAPAYASRNATFFRRDNNNSRNPLNSPLWISVELVIYLAQIVAAGVVLVVSKHERPRAPLFAWLIGYTIGCIASLPLIYWRYIHRNRPASEQDPEEAPTTNPRRTSSHQMEDNAQRSNVQVLRFGCNISISCPRLDTVVYHSKMALDCFFAIWFVVGNVWLFGRHSSSSDAPNLYRTCLVFLMFSCIGYAIPFIMCAAICCCFPCIISLLRFQEDLGQTRGATEDLINALPTYKFKPKRCKNWGNDNTASSDNLGEGGILGPGTKKERIISAEDAMCCICLAKYADDEELRELPCTHFFHVQCVDKWLKINSTCPLCKSELGGTARSLLGLTFGRRRNERPLGRGLVGSRFTV